MEDKIFINQFLSKGLKSFFAHSKENVFEAHIVECLGDIYGIERLQKLYDSNDEAAFVSLLQMYGLKGTLYDNFLRDTNKFEKFIEDKAKDLGLKSDLPSKVESAVITMYLYRCLLVEPTSEEISHFENDLLNNFEVIKFHFNASLVPNKTRDTWNKKKKMLTENVELVEIVPEYLDAFTYAKFGTSIEEVQKMDYRMVEELNSYIKSRMALDVEDTKPKKEKTSKNILSDTAISSGNGFVDALLIAGIITTEISIGLIYLFLHM